jgi:hypothetical protein
MAVYNVTVCDPTTGRKYALWYEDGAAAFAGPDLEAFLHDMTPDEVEYARQAYHQHYQNHPDAECHHRST